MVGLTRYAPTPSGYLHFGNALNFFLIWAWAQKRSANILLRIDDVDSSRFRQEYLEDIFRSLEWLGLDYQVGPKSKSDFLSNYSQQLKMKHYREHVNKLLENKMAYYCDCSRSEVSKRYGDNCYGGYCRKRGLESGIIRFNLEEAKVRRIVESSVYPVLIKDMGDFAIVDRDGHALYQLVSVLEDVAYGIDLVIRGIDLYASTLAQSVLAAALEYQSFKKIEFIFHELINDGQGRKLSKSDGAFALKTIYESNSSPATFYQWASQRLNVECKKESARELADSLPENFFNQTKVYFS